MGMAFHSECASDRAFSSASSIRSGRAFTLLELLAVMVLLSLITISLFTIFQQGSDTWRLSAARTEAYIKARNILEMMSREIRGAVLITQARGPEAYLKDESFRDPPFSANFRGFNGDNDEFQRNLPGWRDTSSGSSREQRYSDQVYFVAPVTNSAEQDLCMIGYFVKDVNGDTAAPLPPSRVPRSSEDDAFWRCYLTDNPKNDPDDEWRTFDFSSKSLNSYISQTGEVATSVRQLDIKYYDYAATGRLEEYGAWDSRPSTHGGTTPTNKDDNKLPAAVRITITVGDKDNLIKGITLSTIVYLENARRR